MKKMNKLSSISKILVHSEQTFVCEKCKSTIEWTFNDDCYIYLPKSTIRLKCPHCETQYDVMLNMKMVGKND